MTQASGIVLPKGRFPISLYSYAILAELRTFQGLLTAACRMYLSAVTSKPEVARAQSKKEPLKELLSASWLLV